MAYAFVQQAATDNAATATTVTVTLTPTAGNLLVFCVSGDALDTTSIALSDNLGGGGASNTFTQIATDLVSVADQRCAWWFAANCKSGATTFTATFSATTRFRTIYVAEYSGIATTSPFLNGARAEQNGPGTGTDVTTSGTANATSQPALVWGFSINVNGNSAATAGTGFTSRTNVWSSATCQGRPEDKRVTATGNVAATWTATTGTDPHANGVGIFAEAVVPVFDDDTATRPPWSVPWAPVRVGAADGDDTIAVTVSALDEDVAVSVPRALAWALPWSSVADEDLPITVASTIVDDSTESATSVVVPAAASVLRVADEEFPGTAPGGSMVDDSTPSMPATAVQAITPQQHASDGEIPGIVGAIVDDSTDAVMRPVAIQSSVPRPPAGDELVPFVATVSPSTIFPLRVSLSGRHLEQADGAPFLVCADTTWSLFVDLPQAGVSSYFNTLVSQGFNTLMGNTIEHHYTVVKPPKNVSGALPFTQRMDATTYTGSPNGTSGAAGTQGQFSSDNYGSPSSQSPDCTFINNTYWLAVEQILDAALAAGLAVFVWPGYLGFHAGDEGWMGEMVVWDAATGAGGFTGQPWADPSKSKLWNYGAWLAARWKNYPNIVWTMGGDYGTNTQTLSTPQRAAVVSLVAGMKSVAGQQSLLWTAHWDRPCISDDNPISGVTFDINFGYCDEAVAELVRRGYSTAVKPSILGEYNYEDGLFGGSAPWRKYTWWGFLGGIAGGFYGHEQLWRFDDGTPGTDYTTLLATQARLDAARQFTLWKSLPWQRLRPSGLGGMGTIITAGGGTASPQSTTYVAAAATAAGDLLLAYIPPAHTGTITVDMTKMVASCRARWFDPTDGSFTAIGTIANTGTHAFTTPATNSDGDTDFLLVLDIDGAELDEDVSRWPSATFVPASPNRAGIEDELTASITVDDDSRSWAPVLTGLAATPPRGAEDEMLASIVDEDSSQSALPLRDWTVLHAPTDDDVPTAVASVQLDDGDQTPLSATVRDVSLVARVAADEEIPTAVVTTCLDDIDGQQSIGVARDMSPVAGRAADDDLPSAPGATLVDDGDSLPQPVASLRELLSLRASVSDDLPPVATLLDDGDAQTSMALPREWPTFRASPDDDAPSQMVEDVPWTFAIQWSAAPLLVGAGIEEFPGTAAPPSIFGLDDDQLGATWPLSWAPTVPSISSSSDELAIEPLPPPDPIVVLEDAIYAWVLAGSGLAADHVIWADTGPIPAGTYIAIRLKGGKRVSSDWLISRTVGSQIIHHARGTRNPTLELTCFAGATSGSRRCEAILDRVLTSYTLPTIAARLRAGDVGVGTIGPIRTVDGMRGQMFDPRAIVEVVLHTMVDVSEVGSSIETVNATVQTQGGTTPVEVDKP